MTTSSGYLRDRSKSNGLCSTPSIVAPSWLFHDTTSSVLVAQFNVCALVSVSFFARRVRLAPDTTDSRGATNTSAIDVGSDPRNATDDPSRESENDDMTTASPGASRVISGGVRLEPDPTSSRNRYDHVCCDAEKNRPLGFHATRFGSSSNAELRGAGTPPLDETVAMSEFV